VTRPRPKVFVLKEFVRCSVDDTAAIAQWYMAHSHQRRGPVLREKGRKSDCTICRSRLDVFDGEDGGNALPSNQYAQRHVAGGRA
jgi:hypothetical protein